MTSPSSSVGTVEDLRTGRRWFDSLAGPIFYPRINNTHGDRIHSYLSPVSIVSSMVMLESIQWLGKNIVHRWLKELQERVNWCTGGCDMTEITLKVALDTIQSINQSFFNQRF